MPRTVKAELDALMNEALPMHAGTDTGLIEQLGSTPFDDPGADASEYILGAALLEHDVIYAVLAQELPEQQAGRSGANDRHLRTHQRAAGGNAAGTPDL
jgi:hypothetical protein